MNATWKLIISIIAKALALLAAGLGVYACIFGLAPLL